MGGHEGVKEGLEFHSQNLEREREREPEPQYNID